MTANWKTCALHGDENPHVWGCPECLRILRAENERLRAVLGRIAAGAVMGPANWTHGDALHAYQRLAGAALAGTP